MSTDIWVYPVADRWQEPINPLENLSAELRHYAQRLTNLKARENLDGCALHDIENLIADMQSLSNALTRSPYQAPA